MGETGKIGLETEFCVLYKYSDYFYISDVDDRDYLAGLIKATIPSLPKPKAKKNPMK